MWFLDLKFLELIRIWWIEARFEGYKMFIFISKMKMLKEQILIWKKDPFNNIFKEKIEIEVKLRDLNL